MQQVNRANLTKESKFFLLKLFSCDKNWIPVRRIHFLWHELQSLNKNIFIYCDKIYLLWIKIVYFLQNIFLSEKITFCYRICFLKWREWLEILYLISNQLSVPKPNFNSMQLGLMLDKIAETRFLRHHGIQDGRKIWGEK